MASKNAHCNKNDAAEGSDSSILLTAITAVGSTRSSSLSVVSAGGPSTDVNQGGSHRSHNRFDRNKMGHAIVQLEPLTNDHIYTGKNDITVQLSPVLKHTSEMEGVKKKHYKPIEGNNNGALPSQQSSLPPLFHSPSSHSPPKPLLPPKISDPITAAKELQMRRDAVRDPHHRNNKQASTNHLLPNDVMTYNDTTDILSTTTDQRSSIDAVVCSSNSENSRIERSVDDNSGILDPAVVVDAMVDMAIISDVVQPSDSTVELSVQLADKKHLLSVLDKSLKENHLVSDETGNNSLKETINEDEELLLKLENELKYLEHQRVIYDLDATVLEENASGQHIPDINDSIEGASLEASVSDYSKMTKSTTDGNRSGKHSRPKSDKSKSASLHTLPIVLDDGVKLFVQLDDAGNPKQVLLAPIR
jgi:hypothetical protein